MAPTRRRGSGGSLARGDAGGTTTDGCGLTAGGLVSVATSLDASGNATVIGSRAMLTARAKADTSSVQSSTSDESSRVPRLFALCIDDVRTCSQLGPFLEHFG